MPRTSAADSVPPLLDGSRFEQHPDDRSEREAQDVDRDGAAGGIRGRFLPEANVGPDNAQVEVGDVVAPGPDEGNQADQRVNDAKDSSRNLLGSPCQRRECRGGSAL
jgi:hypothetical protein